MPGSIQHFCKLFADDTKLIATIKGIEDHQTLQNDLDALISWANEWKMCFNEKKCKFMVFGNSNRNSPNEAFSCDPLLNPNWEVDPHNRHLQLIMFDDKKTLHILEESTCEKDLGILVDNRVSWRYQIHLAIARAYASLGNLKRNFKHWTPQNFKTLNTTLVRPHLEFCASAWCPNNQSDIAALEAVQKNATKLIPALRSLHYEDRISALGLTTLETRRVRGDLIQFFKFKKEINVISWVRPHLPTPSCLLDGPAGRVRGNNERLDWLSCKNKDRDNFFSNRVIPIWNRLPQEITNAESVNSFKHRIDKIYLKKSLLKKYKIKTPHS